MEESKNMNQRYIVREETRSRIEWNAKELLNIIERSTKANAVFIDQYANAIIDIINNEMKMMSVPPTAIGFVHPSLTPDGRFTYSFFPAEFNDHWRQENDIQKN